jgi:hypothetical protein
MLGGVCFAKTRLASAAPLSFDGHPVSPQSSHRGTNITELRPTSYHIRHPFIRRSDQAGLSRSVSSTAHWCWWVSRTTQQRVGTFYLIDAGPVLATRTLWTPAAGDPRADLLYHFIMLTTASHRRKQQRGVGHTARDLGSEFQQLLRIRLPARLVPGDSRIAGAFGRLMTSQHLCIRAHPCCRLNIRRLESSPRKKVDFAYCCSETSTLISVYLLIHHNIPEPNSPLPPHLNCANSCSIPYSTSSPLDLSIESITRLPFFLTPIS